MDIRILSTIGVINCYPPLCGGSQKAVYSLSFAGSHDLDACLLRGQRRLATLEAVQSDRGSTMEGLLPKGAALLFLCWWTWLSFLLASSPWRLHIAGPPRVCLQ